MSQLTPLHELTLDPERLLQIQRHDLVPLLQDQHRLNHYADHLIQAQSVLMNGVDPVLRQDLSQIIEKLIQALNNSDHYLKKRHFGAFRRWFGHDLDYASKQIEYYQDLDHLLKRADQISQKLHVEIQKNQSRYQQLLGLREQMAHYIQAGQQFLHEYPKFVQKQHPLDTFHQRLSKKVNSLMVLQSHNDMAMMQMYLSQQLSFSLLDRFKEAQQVLIPAWQYHVQQSQHAQSNDMLTKLNQSRDRLIDTLRNSLQKPS